MQSNKKSKQIKNTGTKNRLTGEILRSSRLAIENYLRKHMHWELILESWGDFDVSAMLS